MSLGGTLIYIFDSNNEKDVGRFEIKMTGIPRPELFRTCWTALPDIPCMRISSNTQAAKIEKFRGEKIFTAHRPTAFRFQ